MTKEILITGCSTGIGYETAHLLRLRGYRVFATARKTEDVERLRKEGLEAFKLDLDSTQSINDALDWVLDRPVAHCMRYLTMEPMVNPVR